MVLKDYYEKEPMQTHTKNIDGINVLFQYGRVVPSFDTWHQTEKTRKYVNLNGPWKFLFDLENKGIEEKWFDINYDDSNWVDVSVPHCFETMDPTIFQSFQNNVYGVGAGFIDGFSWYRKKFILDETWDNKAITLKFLGTYYSAWVFINGEFVGVHENGHTAFSMDISSFVKTGENVVSVRILRDKWYDDYTKERPSEIEIKTHVVHKAVDYWPYGGITRDVFIEGTNKIFVSKLLLNATKHKLEIKAIICNDSEQDEEVTVTINPGKGTGGKEIKIHLVVKAQGVRVISKYLDIPNVLDWDLEHPNLYEAVVTVEKDGIVDALSSKYGHREIKIDDVKLRMNGKALFLKGTNWHEETYNSGRAMTNDEYDNELGMMKESGAIFLRNCVYNRHMYSYEYCDQNGLLMLDDIDNMWVSQEMEKYQYETYGLSRTLALKMAWNNMNHPSVIMWCIQNECDMSNQDVFRAWVQDMYDAVRSLDIQRRPITQAQQSVRWYDPSFDICDIIGVNEYLGTHHEPDKEHELGKRLYEIHEKYPHKPILITENGAWSQLGDEKGEDWHIERFNTHYNQVLEESDYTIGYVMWVFKDYKTRLPYARKSNGISGMGLVTFDKMEKKRIFNVFKEAKVPDYDKEK